MCKMWFRYLGVHMWKVVKYELPTRLHVTDMRRICFLFCSNKSKYKLGNGNENNIQK